MRRGQKEKINIMEHLNQDEQAESLSGIGQIKSAFISSKSFVSGKIKNGKACCDKCGRPFPHIHPMFVIADELSEELLCYPCNYKRMGIDVSEFYKSKRSQSELEALKAQNRSIETLKSNRKKKKDAGAKPQKKVESNSIKTPDLFSE